VERIRAARDPITAVAMRTACRTSIPHSRAKCRANLAGDVTGGDDRRGASNKYQELRAVLGDPMAD